LALSQIDPETNAIPESEEVFDSGKRWPLDTIQTVTDRAVESDRLYPYENQKKLPLKEPRTGNEEGEPNLKWGARQGIDRLDNGRRLSPRGPTTEIG
jgi:hypothetical protein